MRSQSQANKVLILHGCCSILCCVPGPEAVRQSFDLGADDDEVIQGESPLTGTVLGQQVLDKLRTEPEEHPDERTETV